MTTNLPTISIIIPAANEERYIARALDSIASQSYPPLEIIVVVNGSNDHTADIARRYTYKVLEYPFLLGYSIARNEGANIASGDVLIFMDADSYLEQDSLIQIGQDAGHNIFGTLRGAPDNGKLVYKIFFAFKNTVHMLGFYKGVLGGVLFCDKNLFKTVGGYNPSLRADENFDFSKRVRMLGGKYLLIRTRRAYTSMRRFEKYGILPILVSWIKIRVTYIFRSRNPVNSEYKLRL